MCKIKFEDIMRCDRDNWNSFLHLVKNFYNIACYIGTGLSLYYRSWGEPFVWILDRMKSDGYLERLDTDAIKVSGECGIPINGAEEEEVYRQLRDYVNNCKYLEVGEVLENILKKHGTTFNKYFCKAIQEQNNRAAALAGKDIEQIRNGGLPEDSIYYVPYIGRKVQGTYITTNCDNSIEMAFSDLQISYHQYSGADLCHRDIKHAEDNENNEKQIFYIHGRVHPQRDDSKSLVMANKSYDKKYSIKDRRTFNIALLEKISFRKTFLFLGASLDGDPAVQFIKPRIATSECHHVAFFKMPTIPEEQRRMHIADRKQFLERLSIGTIFLPDFSCYSTVLCQLIREAKSRFWNFQSIFSAYLLSDMQESDEINNIMESSEEFRYKYMINHDARFILAALKKYVYGAESFTRKPGWSICYVESDDFNFPISKHENSETFIIENYNAPLGDTVYLISNELGENIISDIIESIREWKISNNRKENGFENIKIRIIIFKGDARAANKIRLKAENSGKNEYYTENDEIDKNILGSGHVAESNCIRDKRRTDEIDKMKGEIIDE